MHWDEGLEASDAPAVRKIKRDAATRQLPVRVADSGDRDEHAVYNEDVGRDDEVG